jgi:hypothetical protein
LFARIKGAVARAEIERKKEPQLRASLQRAENGKGWGPKAFGYNGDHNYPDLVPTEAAAVREAYHSILAGDSLLSVAKKWNNAGYRTNRGNEWDTIQVKRLLLNPRYAGLRSYRREILYKDGEPVPGDWPAIIDMDTWEAVRYLLTDVAKRPGAPGKARKRLLGGLLTCAVCGHPMNSGNHKYGDGRSRPVYKCKNVMCNGVVRRQCLIDPWVQTTILNRIREKGWKLASNVDAEQVEALHAEATTLRTRMESLGLDYAKGNLNAVQVKVATDELERRLREVEAQLARLAKSEVFEGLIGAEDLLERWEGLGLDRKRAVIKALVDKIEVFPVGVKGRAANKLPMGHNIKVHWRKPEQA